MVLWATSHSSFVLLWNLVLMIWYSLTCSEHPAQLTHMSPTLIKLPRTCLQCWNASHVLILLEIITLCAGLWRSSHVATSLIHTSSTLAIKHILAGLSAAIIILLHEYPQIFQYTLSIIRNWRLWQLLVAARNNFIIIHKLYCFIVCSCKTILVRSLLILPSTP